MKHFLLFLCLQGLLLTATPSYSEPPPAHTVFKLKVKTQDPNTFVLEWQIKPGYFLYQDRLHVTQTSPDFFELTPLKLPKAKTKVDALNQTISIYRNTLRVPVSMIGLHSGEGILDLSYQGCADSGFCYPPQSTSIKLSINPQLALTHAALIPPAKTKSIAPAQIAPPVDPSFSGHHWSMTLLIFLGLGILLSFTPCVLPMIPVLSGILVGHGKDLSTRKAFLLSLSYVLSMSLTYAAIGAVVALMGHNLQVLLQSPIAIAGFSFIFVLLALAMFDVYELKLPEAIQAKLAATSYQQAKGHHYLGAACMGSLSTLILSPCVTAPLIGALSYIAQTGNIALGTAALFCLGLGMGLPLLLIGASLGRLLPHAGNWMNLIKRLFGLMLLAVAVYLMSRLLSGFINMLLWSALLIFSGLTLGAFKQAASNGMRFMRCMGILLLTYGILILVGASLGNTNPLKPLVHTQAQQHTAQVITTMGELEIMLQAAQQKQQPVLLDFYADWCTSCQAIESTTLNHPEILKALNNIQLIKVDLSANNHDSRALLHEFNVVAPPTFIFIDASGHEREELRLVGHISVTDLLNHLQIKTLLPRAAGVTALIDDTP